MGIAYVAGGHLKRSSGHIRFLFLLLFVLWPIGGACPICLGIKLRPPSFAETLAKSDRIVIARPAGGNEFVVTRIETRYLLDTDRTLAEIQAARLALAMHGRDGDPDLRETIAEAFARFVRKLPPISGLVADDLLAWKQWDLWQKYADLLISRKPVLPSTYAAVVRYLEACPEPGAAEALNKIQKRHQ